MVDTWRLGDVGSGTAVLALVDGGDGSVRAEVAVLGPAGLRVAQPGEGVVAALVRRWAGGDPDGRFRRTWHAGPPLDVLPEVQVSTDHANRSVAAGQVHVKLLSSARPGADAGTDLVEHLRLVGFSGVPPHLGTLGWDGPDGPLVVAIASRYLDGAAEGWGRFRDQVTAHLEGRRPLEAALVGVEGLGRLVAGFHAALATPSPALPTAVVRAGHEDLRRWRARGEATLEEAFALTGDRDGGALARRVPELRRRIATLTRFRSVVATRVHGDLHVGQVLHVEGEDHLTDLDGAPGVRDLGSELVAPPARDVAALLRSLDHVGRLADRRAGWRATAAVERWIAEARARCLTGYLDELGARGHDGLFEPDLLVPFEAIQACHELAYAARSLPDWAPIADAALVGLIPDGAPRDRAVTGPRVDGRGGEDEEGAGGR